MKPVAVRAHPMQNTVVPVTMGGNSFRSTLAGTKDMPISMSEHTIHVPRNLPYA